jgi:integrase
VTATTRIRAALSDVMLRGLKPPAKGRIELFDTVAPGLEARLTTHGVLTFSTVVRTRDGERPRLTLGRYPEITLAQARKWARDQRAAVRLGTNPAAEQRAARAARAAQDARPTVAARLAEWQNAKAADWKPGYAAGVQRMAEKFINPALGDVALVDISRAQWIKLVSDVRAPRQKSRKPSASTATWLYTTLSSFLSHAEAVGWIEAHPLPRKGLIKVAPKVTPRERVLSDAELVAVWQASAKRSPKMKAFIRLSFLSGARQDEVANIAKGEIDLAASCWTIPAERTKNARAITIPLGTLARAELAAVWPDEPAGDTYRLLGAVTGGGLAGFSSLKRRVDADLKAAGHTLKPWRWHDLRRTVRTGLSRLGVNDTVAELAVNHISVMSGLRGTYDRHDYGQEIIDALTKWQDHVRALLRENVLPFSRATA